MGEAGRILRQDFRQAARYRPDDAMVQLGLALGAFEAQLFPEAEAAARRAVELDPSIDNAWIVWGRALEVQGKTQEAAELLRRMDARPRR